VEHVSGGILWANLHLLFWLSLIPFVTGWMGDNHFAPLPTAVYGVVLLASAIAFTLLRNAIVSHQGPHSKLRAALGSDRKSLVSLACYTAAVPLAFVASWMSHVLYVFVAALWLVPDRRIEAKLGQ
jgi:uncharacterized membrane protein